MQTSATLLQLHAILAQFSIATLSQLEINYLQLHYMEKLNHEEIAEVLECERPTLMQLAGKFAEAAAYQPLAKSTI